MNLPDHTVRRVPVRRTPHARHDPPQRGRNEKCKTTEKKLDELLEEMREWVKQELAEWDRAARLRQEEAAAALDQKLETMKAEWAKHELPWWDGEARLPQEEAATAPWHKVEAIDAHSPITADVLRASGIDLVKDKIPADQVQPPGGRLQITVNELAALLRTPTHKLKDFTPLWDPQKADTLARENPALYRVIRELARRARDSKKG